MVISKSCISSPIEAGPSLLDSQNLSPHLVEALDYISARLIRKNVSLTLILVRDDIQLPLPSANSTTFEPQTPSSPTSFFSRALSPTQCTSPTWPTTPMTPTAPLSPLSLFSPRLPLFTQSLPSTPLTPSSPFQRPSSQNSTSTTSSSTSTCSPPPTTLTLLPASLHTPKAHRILLSILHKASHKFSLSVSLPSTSHLLILRSIHQNDVLFSNEGLTLLSLDRTYTLKLALSSYSRLLSTSPGSPTILATALNALRLHVLHSKQPLAKSHLLRSYDHLPVSIFALRAMNRAYQSYYAGAPEPISGVEAEVPRLVATVPRRLARERGSALTMSSMHSCRGPFARGPVTPGGWEDITPITRGEWSFFMGGREAERRGVEAW